VLRNADVGDAAFIVQLRTDPAKSRYISATSPEVAEQIAWLEQYAQNPREAYFVAEDQAGERAGTVRIYDAEGDRFCFGSWVMRPGAAISHAVEALLIIYHYALEELGFNRSYFAVRKANRSVWNFMQKFGAVRTHETDLDYWYETGRAPVLASFERMASLLPNGIRVIA
jgi:RimJ/RimL family protein N-acetyltransferase